MLAEIVLVLADANGFRIDLDEFGQRVLQPPGDRDRAAQRHVEVGQFLGGKGRGGIDRSTGLGHDDLRKLLLRLQSNQLGRELIRLARRSTIADRDQLDAVRAGA
jgi:hypothetical protein